MSATAILATLVRLVHRKLASASEELASLMARVSARTVGLAWTAHFKRASTTALRMLVTGSAAMELACAVRLGPAIIVRPLPARTCALGTARATRRQVFAHAMWALLETIARSRLAIITAERTVDVRVLCVFAMMAGSARHVKCLHVPSTAPEVAFVQMGSASAIRARPVVDARSMSVRMIARVTDRAIL